MRQDKRLAHLLGQIMDIASAEAGGVYIADQDRLEVAVFAAPLDSTEEEADDLLLWAEGYLRQNDDALCQSIAIGGMQQALVYPLGLPGERLGGVAVFSSQAERYTQIEIQALDPLLDLTRAVLENTILTRRLATTESVAMTARAIARNPSPQNIVHVLRDYLFNTNISGCVMALFGPTYHDRPNTDFDYIEIKGSWSRRMGSGAGVGVRFNLQTYHEVLAALDEAKTMTLTNIQAHLPEQTDEFVRVMLQIDQVESITLLQLQSDQRKLGIIAITSDREHEFTPYELRTYQIIGEFLTISTMSEVLQRQADFVQQGRAALLDAVTDAVVMVLPDESTSVLTINDHFTTMFGLREREIQGVSLYTLLDRMNIPGSVRRELRHLWQSRPASGGNLSGEFRMVSMEGTPTDVQWYSAPVYQEQQIIGYIYTFHDITPERTSERLRSELLSRISHELRTPLTSIRGFAEFILEVGGDELPDVAREYTEIIHKSAKHLNHLFTDMIEITRANAGELKLHLNDVHMAELVDEIILRMEPQYRERGQRILATIERDMPEVHIDFDRIDQVMTNLISNAIKYSPAGSAITVSLSYIQYMEALPPSAPPDMFVPCALISVIDQGNGLAPEDTEKVFLPFYRTRVAQVDKVEGTGLGLAIAHSIVELHRGKLWAEPNTRQTPGGRFFFTIPTIQ